MNDYATDHMTVRGHARHVTDEELNKVDLTFGNLNDLDSGGGTHTLGELLTPVEITEVRRFAYNLLDGTRGWIPAVRDAAVLLGLVIPDDCTGYYSGERHLWHDRDYPVVGCSVHDEHRPEMPAPALIPGWMYAEAAAQYFSLVERNVSEGHDARRLVSTDDLPEAGFGQGEARAEAIDVLVQVLDRHYSEVSVEDDDLLRLGFDPYFDELLHDLKVRVLVEDERAAEQAERDRADEITDRGCPRCSSTIAVRCSDPERTVGESVYMTCDRDNGGCGLRYHDGR